MTEAGHASDSVRATFWFIGANGVSQSFQVKQKTIKFGRSSTGAAPFHAIIQKISDGGWLLVSIGTDAPTYLNDKVVTDPVLLQSFDQIRIGTKTFTADFDGGDVAPQVGPRRRSEPESAPPVVPHRRERKKAATKKGLSSTPGPTRSKRTPQHPLVTPNRKASSSRSSGAHKSPKSSKKTSKQPSGTPKAAKSSRTPKKSVPVPHSPRRAALLASDRRVPQTDVRRRKRGGGDPLDALATPMGNRRTRNPIQRVQATPAYDEDEDDISSLGEHDFVPDAHSGHEPEMNAAESSGDDDSAFATPSLSSNDDDTDDDADGAQARVSEERPRSPSGTKRNRTPRAASSLHISAVEAAAAAVRRKSLSSASKKRRTGAPGSARSVRVVTPEAVGLNRAVQSARRQRQRRDLTPRPSTLTPRHTGVFPLRSSAGASAPVTAVGAALSEYREHPVQMDTSLQDEIVVGEHYVSVPTANGSPNPSSDAVQPSSPSVVLRPRLSIMPHLVVGSGRRPGRIGSPARRAVLEELMASVVTQSGTQGPPPSSPAVAVVLKAIEQQRSPTKSPRRSVRSTRKSAKRSSARLVMSPKARSAAGHGHGSPMPKKRTKLRKRLDAELAQVDDEDEEEEASSSEVASADEASSSLSSAHEDAAQDAMDDNADINASGEEYTTDSSGEVSSSEPNNRSPKRTPSGGRKGKQRTPQKKAKVVVEEEEEEEEDADAEDVDVDSMSYKEMQKLVRELGLRPHNRSKVALIEALKGHFASTEQHSDEVETGTEEEDEEEDVDVEGSVDDSSAGDDSSATTEEAQGSSETMEEDDGPDFDVSILKTMSYRDMQSLAKDNGLSAGGKAAVLRQRLRDYFS